MRSINLLATYKLGAGIYVLIPFLCLLGELDSFCLLNMWLNFETVKVKLTYGNFISSSRRSTTILFKKTVGLWFEIQCPVCSGSEVPFLPGFIPPQSKFSNIPRSFPPEHLCTSHWLPLPPGLLSLLFAQWLLFEYYFLRSLLTSLAVEAQGTLHHITSGHHLLMDLLCLIKQNTEHCLRI